MVGIARDVKVGCDVPINVLPGMFTPDPERLARFEREARPWVPAARRWAASRSGSGRRW